MSKYLKEMLIESSLWIVFCAMAYAFTFEFDGPSFGYRYGPASWPRMLILVLTVCTLSLLATSAVAYRRKGKAAELEPTSPAEDEVHGKMARLKLIGSFLVPLVYIYLLPRTGFYLTTPFLISGYMYLLGERRLIHLVGSTLLIFALCILIFTVLLYVPLPVGNWTGFYEINNAFLSLIK
jgi:hypothetical protein